MSNELFSCALPDNCKAIKGEPTQVLVRFYGEGCCDANELNTFRILSTKNISPRLYGDFEDGRIEEFLPSTNLTYKDLKDTHISAIIAKRLATIHTLDIPITGQSNRKPCIVNKCNQFLDAIVEQTATKSLKYILNNCDLKQSTRRLARQVLSIDFNKEIDFLQAVSLQSKSPIVFSHNDIHRGNLLLTEICENRSSLSDRIVFIDFEYSGYNHRSYDITNYFIEHCFDYNDHTYPYFEYCEDKYPTESEQLLFAKNYLIQYEKTLKNKQRFKKTAGIKTSQSNNTNAIANSKTKNGNKSQNLISIQSTNRALDIDDDDCISVRDTNQSISNGVHSRCQSIVLNETESDLLAEVESLKIHSHFFWMLWSIKLALTSQIKFGYWVSWHCFVFIIQI